MHMIRRPWCDSERRAALIFVGLALVLIAGCWEPYRPALTDDQARKFSAKQKPVPPPMLAVSGETITVDTIYNFRKDLGAKRIPLGLYLATVAENSDEERFKNVARPEIQAALETLIYDTLLYQKAKREGGDKMKDGLDKAADRIWREFVVEHSGNEAAAEEALRQMGIDRKEFKELRKRQILTHYLVSLKFPADQPVSHLEMVGYYNHDKDKDFVIKPRLTFRLIDIQPGRLQLTDLTLDRYDQARQLSKDLMARLAAGGDFGQLAQQYSHDPMAGSGGLWNSIDPESLAEPYDALAAKAANCPIGQVDGPIELKGHLFIVRLEAKQEQGYQPLDKVQAKIEEEIRNDRYRQAQDQLQADLAERAKAGQTEAFVNGCVEEIYRRSRTTP